MAPSAPPSTTKPSASENKFVSLYSDDGLTIVLRNDDELKLLLPATHATAHPVGPMQYPVRITLNEPWTVKAAASEQLPFHCQFALAVETSGYGGALTRCGELTDDGKRLELCNFTQRCATAATRGANGDYVQRRRTHGLGEKAIFPKPYQLVYWYKEHTAYFTNNRGERRESQQWLPMVADTNCMFAKGVCDCSLWQAVMRADMHTVHKVVECAAGGQSEMDRSHDDATSRRFRDLFSSDAFNPPL